MRYTAFIGLASCLVGLTGCSGPNRAAPPGYWRDFIPFHAEYDTREDALRISFCGGQLLPNDLDIRRYQTSSGLAIGYVSDPMWAKGRTWMYASLDQISRLQQPASAAFEIWQWVPEGPEWPAAMRQRIELLVGAPPNISLSFNGTPLEVNVVGPHPGSSQSE